MKIKADFTADLRAESDDIKKRVMDCFKRDGDQIEPHRIGNMYVQIVDVEGGDEFLHIGFKIVSPSEIADRWPHLAAAD